ASSDRTLRLWEVATGKCLTVLQGHEDCAWGVRFIAGYSVDGKWVEGQALVSIGMDQTVRFWHISRPSGSPPASPASEPEPMAGQCFKT
ncbi:WD40 repeat domain-containing protein, partial [Haemophilus parainfluenzae]|uniref:WD40 repeat domain-containing protein n=1 Tax=Haemophilus parainfluenzae TaxID=729 RepID=UPI00124B8021